MSFLQTKPQKCVRLRLETKCPRDMVRFQVMTYSSETGQPIKGAFELLSLSFLANSPIFFLLPKFVFFLYFPSLPVIPLSTG